MTVIICCRRYSAPIDYADSLSFKLRSDGIVARVTDIAGLPACDDLTVRAARLAAECEARSAHGVDIALDKRLPVGGGLGGGSSDAATTLLALNRLWNVNLPGIGLQNLALELGADVPVFIYGRSALGEGIGEDWCPWPCSLRGMWCWCRRSHVSTASACSRS